MKFDRREQTPGLLCRAIFHLIDAGVWLYGPKNFWNFVYKLAGQSLPWLLRNLMN